MIGPAIIAVFSPIVLAQNGLPAPLAEDVFPQLKPILEKALGQSTQMMLRNIDVAQADANRLIGKSLLLPKLDSNVFYSTNSSAVSSNTEVRSTSSGLFYSVAAYQPLFHWGTLKAQVDISKIGLMIAEKNFAEAYRLLAVSIRSQYAGLVLKKINLRNADFALKVATDYLEQDEARLTDGRISSGEIVGSRLAVDEAKLARDRVEADFDQARRYFLRITGFDALDPSEIPTDIDLKGQYYGTGYTAPFMAKFEGIAVEETFQAQILRSYIDQADLSYKVAKFRLYPKFGLSLSVSQQNQTSASLNTVSQVGITSQNISISGTWSLFDGFAAKGSKLSALATKRSYERQLSAYLQTAVEQAQDLERQLSFASESMRLADTRRALVQATVERAEDDRDHGFGSQKAVDASTTALFHSEYVSNIARAEFLNKWAEFLSALNVDPALQNLPANYFRYAN